MYCVMVGLRRGRRVLLVTIAMCLGGILGIMQMIEKDGLERGEEQVRLLNQVSRNSKVLRSFDLLIRGSADLEAVEPLLPLQTTTS